MSEFILNTIAEEMHKELTRMSIEEEIKKRLYGVFQGTKARGLMDLLHGSFKIVGRL